MRARVITAEDPAPNPFTVSRTGPLPEDSSSLPPTQGRVNSPSQPATSSTRTSSVPSLGPYWEQNAAAIGSAVGWNIELAGIRRPNTPMVTHYAGNDPRRPYQKPGQGASPEQYIAEYWERVIKDESQRRWWADRAIALGLAKYDPNSRSGVAEAEFMAGGGVYQLWAHAGDVVRMDPTLNLMTPEAWVDGLFNSNGGAAALEYAKQSAVEEVQNPITTNVTTSSITMNREQADAIADEVAMQVLGRMASKSEMAKARKAMNRMLAANPTVSTYTQDATDPDNLKTTVDTKSGTSAADAAAAYEMKMRRSSEGMAFNVGKNFETALMRLDRGL
jgi:hypothetical protein